MINFLASLLGGKTWLAWVVVAGVSLGALGGAVAYIDHNGYARAEAEGVIKYQKRELELDTQRFKEIDRQATVNSEAKAKEAEKWAQEHARADALEALIVDLQNQADNDPNANNCGIGPDSVDRLNRIQ
jgi:hypothetical protein